MQNNRGTKEKTIGEFCFEAFRTSICENSCPVAETLKTGKNAVRTHVNIFLHQSSLGILMIIAGPKMHPLWQTPILLFLLSAFVVGFPMVIMESLTASKSFELKPETDVLSSLSKFVAPLLGIYLIAKFIHSINVSNFWNCNKQI